MKYEIRVRRIRMAFGESCCFPSSIRLARLDAETRLGKIDTDTTLLHVCPVYV